MKKLSTFLSVLVFCPLILSAQGFEWLRGGTYDPSIPTPESVLGFEIGTYLVDHLQIVDYIHKLAGATDRVQVFKYGQTYERRNLYILAISSPQNMQRLEEIRTTIERLTDPRKTTSSEAAKIAKETPPIAWANFGTDGNETAATSCGIQLSYQLAAGTDPLTMKILENMVTVINPCLSPDSYQWFVTWAKAVTVGKQGTADPFASEHHNEWFISSDGNHYLIDVNRDAFALSQLTTQAAAEMYYHWNPQIWVDSHGEPEEYFFPPYCSPINLNLPSTYYKWTTEFGKNCARYFDQYGWTFVKGENYDHYYPGYFDEGVPSFNGTIGLLHETDGGGSKGFVWEKDDKTLVTLRDATHHQFIGNIASLETLADNREQILNDFYNFRKTGMNEVGKEQFKQYILKPGSDEGRVNSLIELLLRHKIEVYRADKPTSSRKAQTYFDRVSRARNFPAGSYIVPLKQPQKRLLKTLFEPDPKMENKHLKEIEAIKVRNKKLGSAVRKERANISYDVTAWSLPVTFGIEAAFTEDIIPLPMDWLVTTKPETEGKVIGGRAGYAYLFSYMCDAGAKLCGRLLQEGYNVALTLKGFKNSGRNYSRATLVARVQRNPETLHTRINELAQAYGIKVYAVNTAWAEEGISLGSSYVINLKKPRIMVLTNNPTKATAFGAVYSLLDQRFDLRFTAVRTEHFNTVDLFRYNVMIFPDGSASGYERLLGKPGIEKLKNWIKNGGTFIGLKGGAEFTTRKGIQLTDVKLITEVHDREAEKQSGNENIKVKKPVENIWGSIFRVTVNTDYYLGFGYPEEIAVQVLGNYHFSKTKTGANVATFPKKSLIMGHKWKDTEEILEDKLYLADVPLGQGHVILFANDPTFRTYWRGLDRLFLSGILFAPAMQ